jgi:hypothetical protein
MIGRWWSVACGCSVLLGACAITRQGTLSKLPAGPQIPMTVNVTDTDATLKGTDPQSGEEFEGTFHVVEMQGESGKPTPNLPVGGGSMTPGLPPAPRSGGKATIRMVGRLEGSKGTSLKCAIEIERTLTLKGSGMCLIADTNDTNPAYTIRF